MNKNKYNMFSFLLLGLALALNPSCSDDKNLEPAPEAVNIKVSNYAMLYETVHVNTTNVASGTTVTVNFGEGTVVEGKSGMEISHTYTRPGHYTITMEADGYITSTKDIEVGSKPGISEELKCLKDPDNKKVFVAAHRSHTSDTSIPDNSLRAVEAAIAAGTDFIETDVRS
jgi:glycerophosphoryl diester phosphodiesterase